MKLGSYILCAFTSAFARIEREIEVRFGETL